MNKNLKDRKIFISRDISWQKYFDVVYIIKETNQNIYTFSDEGVIFWESLQMGSSYNECIGNITQKLSDYDKSSIEECFCDFLNQLIDYKIIRVEKDEKF